MYVKMSMIAFRVELRSDLLINIFKFYLAMITSQRLRQYMKCVIYIGKSTAIWVRFASQVRSHCKQNSYHWEMLKYIGIFLNF